MLTMIPTRSPGAAISLFRTAEGGFALRIGNTARLLWAVLVVALLADLVWFDAHVGRIGSWLEPEVILSVLGPIISVIVLGWQLEKQHQNTLEANRREAQERLKLDIFNEIAKRIEATSVPLTNLTLTPAAFVGELEIRRQMAPDRQFGALSRDQFSELQAVAQRASDSVTALVSVLEIYEIVIPEFFVLRFRLVESSRQATVAFGDFSLQAAAFLEADGRASLNWPPTAEDSAQLSRLATIAEAAAFRITGIVDDLRVPAQNYLLGGLFPGRRVPERIPGDPAVKITKLPAEAPRD